MRGKWRAAMRAAALLAFMMLAAPALTVLALTVLAQTALALTALAQTTPAQTTPARVVSMNLCSDQLAMLLAGPDQLVSVSFLARDPLVSSMAEEAGSWPVNYGQAEEIFLLQPDLVITGFWSAPLTQRLLTQLGIRVERLAIARNLEEMRANIRQMGEWLGRPQEADALLARFEADLELLRAADPEPLQRPRAAIYAANGYMSGMNSLSDQLIRLAGLNNIAAELGLQQSQVLDLERLVLARPDLVITDQKYAGWSRAEALMEHRAVRLAGRESAVRDHYWTCGTPHIIRAVAELAAAKRRVVTARQLAQAGR